jgi:Fur family transcriptional regulator, ferric uptake regulator
MADARERQQFLELLRGRGQRVTGERLALFDEIFSQHGHIDAEALFGAMKARGLKISRATVYRNLDLLVECGLARKQRLGSRGFLYEHVHPGQQHDHLVCTGCGRVVEFVSPGIAALQAEICRAHGFVPARHTLQITGLCNRCAESEPAKTTGASAPARPVEGIHV